MNQFSEEVTLSGRVAATSYVLIVLSFLFCGFRGLPPQKTTSGFLCVALVSLGLMCTFSPILIRWTNTGKSMAAASAAGAAILVAATVFLQCAGF